MALKKIVVKHVITQGNEEHLNNFVADFLERGYKLIECKFLQYDIHNLDYKFLYVFMDDGK